MAGLLDTFDSGTCLLGGTDVLDLDLDGGIGDREYRPASMSELRDRYEIGIGGLDVDLTGLELPPGRTPVRTVVVPQQRREQVVARVDQACRSGRHVYWVCPLIEESEELRAQAAEATAAAPEAALQGCARGPGPGGAPPAR